MTRAITRGGVAATLSGMALLFVAGCGSAPGAPQAVRSASSPTATSTATSTSAKAVTSSPPAPRTSVTVPSHADTCRGAGAATSTVQIATGTVSVPPLAAVQFVSARQGWVAGAGQILATSDGGRTWQPQYSGPASLYQVDFISASRGWAVGSNAVLTTTDGGKVWTSLPEPCAPIRSVHFVTPDLGWAVAGGSGVRLDGGVPATATGGVLLTTTDGGRSWQSVPGAPASAETVCFSSPSDGFLGTPGRVWRSTDGGRHWTASFAEPPRAAGAGQGEPGDTTVLECAGNSAAWALFLGFGAAMNHSPYLAYATQNARDWHVLFEETYTESATMPSVHAPDGPGTYPGPFSAISPDNAAFVGWIPPKGFGAAPLEMVTGGGAGRSMRGDVGGVTQAYGAAFISATQGWVIGTDQTSAGKQGDYAIEATTDGGRTWSRQYTAQ
jgi:photosystem II stability/assembly factor-like uncharacterized protein